MTFEQWLVASGFGSCEITAQQADSLRGMWLQAMHSSAGAAGIEGALASEHAMVIRPAGQFAAGSFVRKMGRGHVRQSIPETIGLVMGKLAGKNGPADPLVLHALSFPTISWTAAKAKAWIQKTKTYRGQFIHASESRTAAAARHASQELLEANGGIELAAIPVDLVAADPEAETDDGKLPTFKLVAYTGGMMLINGWWHPVVIDLAGLKVSARGRPVLQDHDRSKIVGHTTAVAIAGRTVRVDGVVSGTGDAAMEVVSTAANGFPWRVSVGARPEKMVFVEAGVNASANGQMFKGPVYIARKATLGEVSFVSLAADDRTSAKVAASAGRPENNEVRIMTFEQWLKAGGWDAATLSEEQTTTLRAAYQVAVDASDDVPAPVPTVPPAAPAPAAPQYVTAAGLDTMVTNATAVGVAAERTRVNAINAACAGFEGARVEELKAKALSAEITPDDLRAGLLEHVRSIRATTVPHGTDFDDGRKLLLAAGYRAANVAPERIAEICGQPAVDGAMRIRSLGLQEFCARAAALEGVVLPRYGDAPKAWLTAAFSTISLPGILSNIANKSILEGYNFTEQAWREVAKIASVTDFKQHTRYRMTSDFKFLKIAKDGEIKHGTVDEQAFTNQADTFARMFALTRQDIINDDLSAFAQLPGQIGRGAGDAINDALWTLILSNPGAFFAAGNGNYITGATSNLSIDSLTVAETAFLEQTKPNGTPLGVEAEILLVPPALKVIAEQLYTDLFVNETTTANRAKPNSNPHSGKYRPVHSAYLSNATIAGYSSLAWYLFANPMNIAAFEVAFLNGVDQPTVESADADFNTLGVQFRGYLDFGVKEQDYRGAVKTKGAA